MSYIMLLASLEYNATVYTIPTESLELQNPLYDVHEHHEICQSPDIEAHKLEKVLSG